MAVWTFLGQRRGKSVYLLYSTWTYLHMYQYISPSVAKNIGETAFDVHLANINLFTRIDDRGRCQLFQ